MNFSPRICSLELSVPFFQEKGTRIYFMKHADSNILILNIKKIHFWIILISAFLSLAFSIGAVVAQGRLIDQTIINHQIRLEKLEQITNKRFKLLYEIKFNLKDVMEKNGYIYKEIDGNLDSIIN